MSTLDPMARLIAESEIRNIVARLGHLADDGDIGEYLSLMTEDAEWRSGNGPTRKGHADLRARVLEDRASGIQGPGTATRHVNTALWVKVEDERAYAESYFLYLTNANGGAAGSTTQDSTTPNVQLTGRYHDEFVNTATGWKLKSRTILLNIN